MFEYSVSVTRQELYEQVWKMPFEKLALYYGTSPNELARRCKPNRVPRPIKDQERQKPLPEIRNEKPIEIKLQRIRIGVEEPQLLDTAHNLISFEKLEANRITVSNSLHDTHPVVQRLQRQHAKSKPGYLGLHFCGGPPDIAVTEPHIDRSLRIIDALAKALGSRGYNLQSLKILGHDISFELHEEWDSQLKPGAERRMKADPRRHGYQSEDFDRTPNGKLKLQVESAYCGDSIRKSWKDSKSKKLEDQLNDIICGMIMRAAVIEEKELCWAREKKERAEAAEERAKEKRQREIEETRLTKLYADFDAWKKADMIREYIKGVTETGKSPITELALSDWIRWATAEANRVDPLHD